MTEPQDVLAELHRRFVKARTAAEQDAIWDDILRVDKGMKPEHPRGARAALVRTPETLDVDRLRRAMLNVDEADPGIFNIVAISDPDTRPVAAALAAEYARLAASPAPDPGALREAARRYRAAEWAARIHEDEPRMTPEHNARVEEWRAADAAIAALLGESSPFVAPSAEPPETT